MTRNAYLVFFSLLIYLSTAASTHKQQYEVATDSLTNKQYGAALQLFHQIIAQNPTNDSLIVHCFSGISEAYRKQKQFETALFPAYLALQTAHECLPKSSLVELQMMNDVGFLHSKMGEYDRAKSYLLQTISQAKLLTNANNELATAYKNMAAIYQREPNYAQALIYCQKALDLYTLLRNNNEATKSKISLAIAQKSSGKVDLAEKNYQEVFNNPNTPLDLKMVAGNNLADIYVDRNENKRALAAILQTAHFLETQANEESEGRLITVYKNLSEMNLSFNQPDLATQYLQKALSICQKTYSGKGRNAAQIYIDAGDLAAKLGSLATALQHYQSALLALINNFTPNELSDNPTYEQLSTPNPDVFVLVALRQKAQTYTKLFQQSNNKTYLQNAFKTYQLALYQLQLLQTKLNDNEAKAFLVQNEYPLYQNALQTALLLGDVASAFVVAEQSKSNLLNGFLYQAQLLQTQLPAQLTEQYNQIRQQISLTEVALNKITQIQQKHLLQDSLLLLNQQYQQLNSQIEQQYPNYRTAKYHYQTPNINDIQKQLLHNNKTALLSYFLSDSLIYTFAVTKKGVNYAVVPRPIDLDSQIHNFHQALSKDSVYYSPFLHDYDNNLLYQDIMCYAQYFHELLLQSILGNQNLKGIDRLIIIPDGVLSYIPFEALITKKPDTVAFTDYNYSLKLVDYMLKQYTISYSYSASTLLNIPSKQANNKVKNNHYNTELMAFAPIFKAAKEQQLAQNTQSVLRGCKGNGHLEELKNSYTEVQYIDRIANGKVFLEDSATVDNFKKNVENALILHLSSHACLDDTYAASSKIYFADNKDGIDNDYLETHEIYNLPLHAKLVVLSACQTGIGNMVQGEGMMSLARGFAYGGTPSLLASIWSVNDQSTSELMKQFYAHLFKNEDIDYALRNAKLDYLTHTKSNAKANPFLWAGFVCIGTTDAPIQSSYFLYYITAIILAIILIIIKSLKTMRNYRKT